jgi:alpha-tubulin suppressor-like RCC1 family protein
LAGCGANGPEQTVSLSQSASSRQAQAMAAPAAAAVRISAGVDSVVALNNDGKVVAWGGNQFGQLGQGHTKASSVPVMVNGLSSVTEVHVGGYHMAALKSDHSVWTWGNNSYGQLGVGGLSSVSAAPRKVGGITEVKAVATGYVHTSAIGTDGMVWNWGKMPGRASAVPVKVWGITKAMTSIAAGSDFTLAVASDGMVYGWGGNQYGQVGLGYTSVQVLNPVALPGLTNVLSVSAGQAHALALRTDGSVWAWGSNKDGQLATVTGPASRARPVAGLPTALGANGVRAVIAGASTSAVVYADGSVWMWGGNAAGQFGTGTLEGSKVPVKVNTLAGVAAVTVGQGFVSVLKKDGTVYGIGANPAGQLGNNTTSPTTTPVQVMGISGVGYLDVGASYAP